MDRLGIGEIIVAILVIGTPIYLFVWAVKRFTRDRK